MQHELLKSRAVLCCSPYCKDVGAAIERSWAQALVVLNGCELSEKRVIEQTCYDQECETAPDMLPPIPWKRVDVVKLNVKVDVRYAAHARKLSGAHTVPHVQLITYARHEVCNCVCLGALRIGDAFVLC